MKFQLVSSKPRIFSQHLFSIHRLKVFLLGLVRRESKGHLSLNHCDISVPQADLVAGIDDGCIADSRSIGQIPDRYIGSETDGGVETSRGVAIERIEPDGGVLVACGVEKERHESAGGIVLARSVVQQRLEASSGVIAAGSVA